MANFFRSFRSKMILFFCLSMIFSGLIILIIYKLLQYYYLTQVKYEDTFAEVRRYILFHIGDVNFFLLIFIPLSFLFFYLLTKPYATYFKEISSGIRHLADGNFTNRVHISTKDEFRSIAHDINLASEKLKEAIERGDFAESSKNQLVVNLAHDLRTPLTSVLGYLDIVLRDQDLSKKQVNHYLTIAFTKSQRLEQLIDELFAITRMNYGIAKEKALLDLSELLHQLVEELYPLFEQNNLTARINIADHLNIEGVGDQLARVFENLLTNAIRYGVDGQFVDINGFIDNKEVVVQVINYGDHIPAEELPYLFDMFYTGDKARIQKEGSTGLGLFIAKNIIESHHGTISVESNVIRTVFEVRLTHTLHEQ